MKKFRSFLLTQAFQEHTSLLTILSYLLTYLAVLGLGWAEKSDSISWHWKLSILLFSSILFVIALTRNLNYEKTTKKQQDDDDEREALEEKLRILEKERQDAVNANHAKSRFLAQMSHEIRNPLNSILGFSEMLAKRKLDTKSKKFVDLISQSGDGLMLLLNDILDLNKIGEGKLTMESVAFHFKEVISSSLLPYEYEASQKDIQFELIFDPKLPDMLIADPYRFRQILQNLISNSMKFTQAGKIRVQFIHQGQRDGKVWIRTLVSDTGIGIDPKKLTHIFNPFVQSEESTTRKFGGSGLGLTIVSELVRLMGGEIGVQSPNPMYLSDQGGPGTQFHFDVSLPYAKSNYAAEKVVSDKELDEVLELPQAIHVLVAEDNTVNQVLFQSFLEGLGATSDVVDNGQEAIRALCSKTHYDLVFMDIQMPLMDGLQASKSIRRDLESSIPIIGATANAFKEDIRIALQSGMNDYIPKPFRQKDLYEKIMKWAVKDMANS